MHSAPRVTPEILVFLYRTRIILRERIDRCNIALAPGPIRRLPPELLSEIFRYCLPRYCQPNPASAPLLLCRISSLWRNVAHNTRNLWNRLDFTCRRKPGLKPFIQLLPSCGFPIPPLHNWLSHSQKSQLCLSFNSTHDDILPYLASAVLLPNVADIFRLTSLCHLWWTQNQTRILLLPHPTHISSTCVQTEYCRCIIAKRSVSLRQVQYLNP